ncbi:MAG TPA: helix-turn-helix domain-containing protein [Candidatus Acidoferrales bacterium]|nr:helix-turn-helix domain-containing protein [Candidatus Acidoferrales bacterium]
MKRPAPEQRLADLMDAGVQVFIARGYRRAQMDDVARIARVSKGTIYNYFESKEALFYLIVDRGFGGGPMPSVDELPIRTPSLKRTVARLRQRIEAGGRLPALDRALARRTVDDPRAELETIVREFYAMTAKTRRAADLIERAAIDLPEFADLFFRQNRRGLVDRLARYLERRIALGMFKPLRDRRTAARLILETVVFFARHRHNVPDSSMINDTAAEETTVEFILNALLAAPPTRASRR